MINSKHGKLRNRTRSLYYLMNYLAEFVELIQPQPFTRCFNKNRDRVFDEKREKKGRKKREGGGREGFEERGKKRICAFVRLYLRVGNAAQKVPAAIQVSTWSNIYRSRGRLRNCN